MQKYAGDLDVLQRFTYGSELTVVQQFIRSLKKIIKQLGNDRYFSEFKAGFDPYFKNEDGTEISVNHIVGTLNNGQYIPNEHTKDLINKMHHDKVLNTNECELILIILHLLPNFDISYQQMAYDMIYEIIRNKKILRWTDKEIINGFKIIRNMKYTLAQAIRDKTMVKIDLIVLLNGRFVEVTNMISLCSLHIDENGIEKCTPVNIDSKFLHNADSLKIEIEKLYYSNKFYSPLKVCKRMYALCRVLQDYGYVNKLGQILRGDISLMYQIKSELDTFVILMEKLKNPPIAQINRQLSELKGRLSTVLDIPNDQIIFMSDYIDNTIKTRNMKEKFLLIKIMLSRAKLITSSLAIRKMDNLAKIRPHRYFCLVNINIIDPY